MSSSLRRIRAPLVAWLAVVSLLGASSCSGGGGGGASGSGPDPAPGGATLESTHARLVIDAAGRVESLRLLPDGDELALSGSGTFIEIEHDGSTVVSTSLRLVGSELVARFDTPKGKVRIAVEEKAGYVAFRIREVSVPDVEALRLNVPVRILATSDSPLNGTFDDTSAVCLRPLTASTQCEFFAAAGVLTLTVQWFPRHELVGGAAALVATPRGALFDAIEAMEAAEGLPSPHFAGVRARESAVVRESYLFLTYYVPGDVDAIIEYARVGGFKLILFLRTLWRTSGGTYEIDPARFPGGLAEFVSVCDRIRAAGLRVGVHIYGPSISLDDPLVTPMPREGLLAWDLSSLAGAVAPDSTELTLTGAPDLPAATAGGFPGRYVRVGDEILRYSTLSASPPYVLTGCERGALGTTAAAHASGARVRHLATLYSMFLIDPDGPLVDVVASNLGGVVNAAGIDMVYFDGTGQITTGEHVDRWYYMNRLLPAHLAAFDHPVLVQTGMGPGRQLAWHVVPRSASADGHGDIRWYLDQRTVSIESIRRGFTAPDVGWYGFDEGRPPDHLEYIAAKCLGWDCSLSLQTYKIALEKDPRSRETMEMLGRYERCKAVGGLPAAVRETLLIPGADFRLLEDGSDGWRLHRASYGVEEPVRALEGGDHHAFSVMNPETSTRTVGAEIVRGGAIRVDTSFDDPGGIVIDDFESADAYTTGGDNDFTRLVNRTDPWASPQGIARKGVTHSLVLSGDARSGASCATLATDNQSVGAGWCAVGRRFDAPIDLTGMDALGLWLHGDGSLTTLRIELWDDADQRVQLRAMIHHGGWRLQTWALKPPASFDRSRVRYLVLILSDLPLKSTAAIRLDALRALPTVRPAKSLDGVRLRIGNRLVTLPASLPAGGTVRIDGLGKVTIWPGGMEVGQTFSLPGGPILIAPGLHEARFELLDPTGYPGDATVRAVLLEQIHPK